jgi:hypothetical protein
VRRLLLTLTLGLAVSLVPSLASAGSADRGHPSAEPAPVASLEPAKTAELWNQLVSTRASRTRAAAECRPLRAVFYAASDWLRLATKLAATSSPCAEYFISVPPLVADKTTFRRDQAWRIRALGPNFHAMAEIHFTTWNRWVASTGGSWHAAGVTARERMAAAGYDIALGDTWQLNELSTAVRRGEGNARANIREFLRGLYEGDGSRPTKGAALIVGVGQRTGDLTVYQDTLQNWLTDTAFWTDMATYVSDWTQEVYGDVRSHAVPGAPTSVRREYLNDYLQHKHVLSGVAPETVEPARSYLRETYSALGNAAWQRDTGYGWTMVPAEQMAAYVSAQVNALRHYSATTGQSRDHWGFAWAPRNATGMTNADFGAQTNLILERMAAAIRDSGDVVEPENPGGGACGPPGQDTLCAADVADARHNEAWRTFRGWTQAVLGFGTAPQSIPAGAPSAAITLALVTSSGSRVTSGPPRAVTLRSSSPTGTFSTSPAGPWTPTLALTVVAGVDVTFYYQDTRAGSHTLTASAAGTTNGTQVVTVTAGPVATVAVTPASGAVRARGVRRFVAAATDAFGNAAAATVSWKVTPVVLGTISPGSAGAATFTAGRQLGTGTVTATTGTISATASVTVIPAKLRIGSIALQPGERFLRVTVAATDGARRPVSGTSVKLVVKRDGRRLASARAVTGPAGKARVRLPGGRGCFTVAVTRAVAQGLTWDGRTPRNRVCRR